jgi:hypothetical protein
MRPTTQIYQLATSVYSYCFVRGQIIDDFNLVITEFKKKNDKGGLVCFGSGKIIKTLTKKRSACSDKFAT